MSPRRQMPKISIGVPVYNAEGTVGRALHGLLSQSEPETEIIVSDNASTDGTYEKCATIAASDSRVRLCRQERNIGAAMNFRYVLEQANCEFFMWAAADDFHSPEFVAANLGFLETHPEYGGAISPVQYVGGYCPSEVVGDMTIEQDCPADRIALYVNRWHRNSIFYGVFRTDVLRKAMWRGIPTMGEDWIVIARILRNWKLKRVDSGGLFRRPGGASYSLSVFSPMVRRPLQSLFPLHDLTETVRSEYSTVTGKNHSVASSCSKLTVRGMAMWLILGKRFAMIAGRRALQVARFTLRS
jgi:glycosyltransferase involved in cell wall biosynthesis